MEVNQANKRRGIYLLPNLFTTAALFSGFYAIIAAFNGRFEPAVIAIFVAMILDGVDGRVARLTNTQSAFGAEYDSLSDMVSFGLAPAILIYAWSLSHLGKLGWIAAFIYTAGAALRLARFNTQLAEADKRFFQGLPSPAAAAIIAGMVWVSIDAEKLGVDFRWLAMLLTLFTGVLMVSNVRFYSFKKLDLHGRVPFVALLAMVLVFVLISLHPPQVLFATFIIYALSGPAVTIWLLLRRKRQLRHTGSHPPAPPSPPPTSPAS
ncbi:MAG: CDP-diacylglycerol--serine O-phosphatidyltransferase [Gammaproteobacteria bacterium]|nr:CDP-diacylglycerol--serine O-phosphatidyltransferase [Gammaproteobacteria bacterium]